MKKIMLNDTYGLTEAVLKGRKTMTRRLIPNVETEGGLVPVSFWNGKWCGAHGKPLKRQPYRVGEIIAIAQPYKDCGYDGDAKSGWCYDENQEPVAVHFKQEAGWTNKMFVKAELMPHHIRITGIKLERLQDISDEDCMAEGIQKKSDFPRKKSLPFYFEGGKHEWDNSFRKPREAFAAIIDKVSGKGTWESNPYVFCYTFELVD